MNPHDLQRLIEIVTEEVLAARGAGGVAPAAAVTPCTRTAARHASAA